MDDATIKSIVAAEIAGCGDVNSTILTNERVANLNAYLARPYGTEQEGRSKVVSSDVSDTIEWMMPTLIRIFTSGEDVVEFEPENPNDVDAAKQATEYVNFIWNRDNPGFKNFYSWFKDALISKVGTVKIWWDTTKKTKRERYSGLNDAAFAKLVNDPNVAVSEHTESKQTVPQIDPNTAQLVPTEIPVHDVVLTRTIPGGRVCVEPIPPEEFLISKDARTSEEARLVGHKRKRTLSDLIGSGFDKAKVRACAEDDGNIDTSQEAIARNTVENPTDSEPFTNNMAMREVVVTECYLQIDMDGDGIAEMRKITVAGTGNTILSNDSWDAPRPFAHLTPVIMPHRFYGRAIADVIKDIQLIRTTILRQYLDGLYLNTNPREQIIAKHIIDPEEAQNRVPGAQVRVREQAIFPIQVPDVTSQALEGLNYIDQIRENRTGVSARTQGLGSNPLHDTAKGEQIMMTAAMGKMELIARVFAETGVKDAFRIILKLVTMYQDEPRVVRLTGKDFVPVDPTDWNADMDMRVSVGMGTGDKDQQLQHSLVLGQAQEKLIPLGFVSPENLKNSMDKLGNALGEKGAAERYATFPPGDAAKQPIKLPPPNQKPGTDPQTLMQLEQVKAQAKVQSAGATAQAKAQVDMAHNQMEAQRAQLQAQNDAKLEAFKAHLDANLQIELAHIRNVGQIASAQIAAKASTDNAVLAAEQAGEQQAT